MRYAFISDIHGNYDALLAVSEDIVKTECDKVFVLGDICLRGPEPKLCLELVQEMANGGVIKGNADEWMVRGVNPWEVPDIRLERMQKEQAWARDMLSDEDIGYLAGLRVRLEGSHDGCSFVGFHATPDDLFATVLPQASGAELKEALIGGAKADLFLYGHIHTPYARQIGSQTIVNLGSVGMPFDGLPEASYAIVECTMAEFTVNLRRVPYDVDKAIHRLHVANHPNIEEVAQILRTGRNG